MQFKRRSTFRDKVISGITTFMSVLLLMNVFELWQVTGEIKTLDIVVAIISFGIAALFTNIKKFTYMTFTDDKLIWQRAIFFKKEIKGKEIKEIKAKMNHVILINEQGKEIWIPMAFLRIEDAEEVTERLKRL
ncbi:MAG: hypothetical protein RR324_09490 [Cellulosilyticaceae bacterium]